MGTQQESASALRVSGLVWRHTAEVAEDLFMWGPLVSPGCRSSSSLGAPLPAQAPASAAMTDEEIGRVLADVCTSCASVQMRHVGVHAIAPIVVKLN